MTTPLKKPLPAAGDDKAVLTHQLLEAAYRGDLAAVRSALQGGADIAARHDETGLTALHIAAGTNNLPLARYLVEEWQAPFMPDGFGRWPTVVAASCGAGDELCDYIVEQEAAFLEQKGPE